MSASDSRWPCAVILLLSFYFCVFVLHLLDVNVDDGAGLIKAYEEIRSKNLELQKQEELRQAALEKDRIEHANEEYQGDEISPWVNPFAQAKQGSGQRVMSTQEEVKVLEKELETSIIDFFQRHGDALEASDEVSQLVNEENPVREKLRKRQVYVEERFDAVAQIEASMLPRDYVYKSVLADPELKYKLALPSSVQAESGGKGSFLSSLFASFSGGSKAKREDKEGDLLEPVSAAVTALRSEGTYAAVVAKGAGKSTSVATLESALLEHGYTKHKGGVGLPTWLISYARKCPSLKAILAKDSAHKSHTVFCPGYTEVNTRHVVLAGGSDSLSERSVGFYRIYEESDHQALTSLPAPGFVVLQKGGAGKPQTVKNIATILKNPKYLDPTLELVAAKLENNPALWTGNRAFNIRSWLLVYQGAPMIAYVADGDVVVSSDAFQTYPTGMKETSDMTASMRFPALTITPEGEMGSVELASLRELGEVLGLSESAFKEKILDPIRSTGAALAQSLSARAATVPVSDKVHFVEHICMDFAVDKQLHVRLVASASDCAISATMPETTSILTSRALTVAEYLLVGEELEKAKEGDGLTRVVDQAKGFVYK